MSCSNGCGNTAPTITCLPNPGTTGCLDYISTDCVQFLGASNTIGFGILQNDNLTTIITKISGATIAYNDWIEINLPSANTAAASGFTAKVTLNTKGEVRFTGIINVSGSSTAKTITLAYISSPTYYPATTKGFIQSYNGVSYLIQFLASSGTIIVTNLSGGIGWTVVLDLSPIWYDKNI